MTLTNLLQPVEHCFSNFQVTPHFPLNQDFLKGVSFPHAASSVDSGPVGKERRRKKGRYKLLKLGSCKT